MVPGYEQTELAAQAFRLEKIAGLIVIGCKACAWEIGGACTPYQTFFSNNCLSEICFEVHISLHYYLACRLEIHTMIEDAPQPDKA
jgi:hypothetical protein